MQTHSVPPLELTGRRDHGGMSPVLWGWHLDLSVKDSDHTFLRIQPVFVMLSPERVKGVPHCDQCNKRHLDTWEDILAPDFKRPQLRPRGALRDQDNVVIGVEGG